MALLAGLGLNQAALKSQFAMALTAISKATKEAICQVAIDLGRVGRSEAIVGALPHALIMSPNARQTTFQTLQ